jgi:hypothetical protein
LTHFFSQGERIKKKPREEGMTDTTLTGVEEETRDVTPTYTRKIKSTKGTILASLVIGLICLVGIILLYILTYTGQVHYKYKAGPQGDVGGPGPEGPIGFPGSAGEAGPTGTNGGAAPLQNLQTGSVTVNKSTSNLVTFSFTFSTPYTYDQTNGIANCYVVCEPNWVVFPSNGQQNFPPSGPSCTLNFIFSSDGSTITGCEGTLSANPSSGWLWPLELTWWASNVI